MHVECLSAACWLSCLTVPTRLQLLALLPGPAAWPLPASTPGHHTIRHDTQQPARNITQHMQDNTAQMSRTTHHTAHPAINGSAHPEVRYRLVIGPQALTRAPTLRVQHSAQPSLQQSPWMSTERSIASLTPAHLHLTAAAAAPLSEASMSVHRGSKSAPEAPPRPPDPQSYFRLPRTSQGTNRRQVGQVGLATSGSSTLLSRRLGGCSPSSSSPSSSNSLSPSSSNRFVRALGEVRPGTAGTAAAVTATPSGSSRHCRGAPKGGSSSMS